MELLRGVPVTEYYDKHNVPPRARLELFVQICQAVHHAHQKGIIHRDIKPSNVLVSEHSGIAVPKVIDFGVAKAVNQRLTDRTLQTQMSQLIGTPMYMSPEQAERSAVNVDTRTDIYSLGAVLYELLTGTTPFTREQMSDIGFDEVRRIIREEDPPRPSQRLSTLHARDQSNIAELRSADQLKLIQIMRCEPDWIVLKAMEKDVTRRYETARDFAADIQNYLADEPALACPPSTSYRLRTLASRNKVAVAMAILIGVGVLTGISGLVVNYIMVTRQKNAAETQRVIADENFRLAREAVDRYFTLISEDATLSPSLRKKLIDNAVSFCESLAERRGNAREVLVAVANTRLRMAAMHHRLGDDVDAVTELHNALDMVDDLLDRMPANANEFRDLPGYYHYWRNTYQTRRVTDAECAVFQRAVALWRPFADAHPDVDAFRSDLAFLLPLQGRYLETEQQVAMLKEVQRFQEELIGRHPDNRELLYEKAATNWLIAYSTQDPTGMRDAIATLNQANLPDYRGTLAGWLDDLGWMLMERGQHAEAAEVYKEAFLIHRQLAPESPKQEDRVRHTTDNVARALLTSGQQSEAERLATEISPRTGNDFAWRGNIYGKLRQREKAIADFEKALDLGLIGAVTNIRQAGELLDKARLHEKAIRFYDHHIDYVKTHPDGSIFRVYAQRGAAWVNLKRYDKALADFTTSIEIGARECEHHLSRLSPRALRESPAEFQAAFLKLADRAIELDGSGQSYLTRALVHHALRLREEAKKDLARGVKLDPDFKVRWYLKPLLKELQEEAKAE